LDSSITYNAEQNNDADFEKRSAAFFAALTGEDDLGVIVRGHIHIEHELRALIEVAAPNASFIDFGELDYVQTVKLALILGLNEEFKAPLTATGTLRNKFSHRLGMKIDVNAAMNLHASFGRSSKEFMRGTYEKLRKQFPDLEKPPIITDSEPLDLVVLCLVTLRSGIVSERMKFERSRPVGAR